jgi:outer membrane protein
MKLESELKKVITRRLLGPVLAVALAGTTPLAASAETLADTLADAYRNSGLLEQNRALLRAADEDVAVTVSRLRPILNWSANVTRSFGRNRTGTNRTSLDSSDAGIGITAQLLLYDFGRTGLQVEAAKETVLSTRETLRSIEQQVLLRAVVAFMNVRRNSEFVSLRQNNLRLLEEELRAAQDRFEVGEVTRTDVAQAEARLASAQSGLASAQGNLARAIEEFTSAVGREPGPLRTPQSLPRLAGGIDASKTTALRNHPDILKVQHDVAAAELAIKAADAATRPRVNLNARAGVEDEWSGSNYVRSGSIGIEITGPIYQGGQLSALERQAVARRDAVRGGLLLAQLAVQQDVGNAYADLRAARASREASQEAVRAATVAFRGVREEAKLGARTTLDVLDAEQALLDARTNLISAEIDVYIAAYAILSSIGQLTARDLNLAVQTYDPATYYNLVKTAPAELSPQGRQLDRVLRSLGKE